MIGTRIWRRRPFARGGSWPRTCRLPVGPQYVRPTAPLAPEFKEPLPENFKSEDGWKPRNPATRN
jgi:hypothetical protein